MKKLALTFYFMLLLLSIPAAALANEGSAWIYYLVMAPFALFATPFFLTIVLVAIAVYCYWRYRSAGNKTLGIVALLVLLLAIPVAFRDKASFVAERESRQLNEQRMKEHREARRAGKHVSPNFTAISTAYTAKYQASAKTEADRLNFQASRDMLQMSRSIDAMQQKESPPPQPEVEKEEAPPVRSGKTFLLEIYSIILLAAAGWAGSLVARWRTRRRLTTLIHIAPLCLCLFMPVLAQLPFLWMLPGGTGGRIYFSWLSRIVFTPMSFIVSYLLGVLVYHWRLRRSGEMPACQAPAPEEVQSDIRQAEPVEHAATDEFVHFTCPGCNLAGRIATSKLPEQGLLATCRTCKTSFPVKRDAAPRSSGGVDKPVDDGTSTLQEPVIPEADSGSTARREEINPPLGVKGYLSSLAACRSYFLLQILFIALSWLLGQRSAPVPLIMTQLLLFASPALLACICVMAMRKSPGIAAQVTGVIFALITAIAVYAVQVVANRSFPLKNLVTVSALKYATLAFIIGFIGVGAGGFFVGVERRYGFSPLALFKATILRLRDNSFLIAGWCFFVLVEGLMSPHFHGDAGLIVLPIVVVVDNLPLLVVWLLARVTKADDIPAARAAAILFAGLYALLTVPLHSSDMVLSPVAFFFQMTPFIGVSVMVCTMIALAWIRTRKAIGKPALLGVSTLLPGGGYIYPARSAVLAIAVLGACYGSYNGSRELFDPEHLFVSQIYPEIVFSGPDGKPLAQLPVEVHTSPRQPISFLFLPSVRDERYTLLTDAKGVLHLPPRKPRLATLGIAGLFAGGRHIFLTVVDPRWQVPGSVYSPSYELRDVSTRQTVACQPADIGENLKRSPHLVNSMPSKTWEETIASLESSAGSLDRLSPAQLLNLAAPCDRLISTTCDRIDMALLNHPETPVLIRTKAIDNFKLFASVRRSGNYAEPILSALEQDTGMASWMELLRKEIRLEAQVKSEAAKADGRSAAVIHEEALKLHHQKKYGPAFALYQVVFTSPGPMLPRYFGNASYACSSLGMRSWAMRLARQGLRIDPSHERSADSYAQEAFHFRDYEAAKFWARAALASGFDYDDVYMILGAANMETGDLTQAASFLWMPMEYGSGETWIMPYLKRLGPWPFWQPVPKF